jgi:Kef-type K+ transport system membrane component KefB
VSNSDFGAVALLLFALVATAHLCGFLFTRLRRPRVVGEILAGVIFAPAMLGQFAPAFSAVLAAVVVVAIACAVKLLSAGLGARLAGFSWNDSVNLSMAFNARGGPGIVLASVAFDTGIINAVFFTTLVVVASVLTAQTAGAWLDYILRTGQPLLSGHEVLSIVDTRGEAARP